ncbi:hypothetical protein MTO96_012355 [Rhipicephalus appendiculatus]
MSSAQLGVDSAGKQAKQAGGRVRRLSSGFAADSRHFVFVSSPRFSLASASSSAASSSFSAERAGRSRRSLNWGSHRGGGRQPTTDRLPSGAVRSSAVAGALGWQKGLGCADWPASAVALRGRRAA